MADKKGDGARDASRSLALLDDEIHDTLLQGIYTPGSSRDNFAPQSDLAKFGLVTLEGAKNVIPGIGNALWHDVTHPLDTAKMVGTSAAIGAGMRLVLPEDAAGKAIGTTIGAWMMFRSGAPIYNAYSRGLNANTMGEIKSAGVDLGNAAGSFVVDTAISGVAAGAASKFTGRVLLSERMDGFAEAKYNFWNNTETKFNNFLGNSPEAAVGGSALAGSSLRYHIEGNKATLVETARTAPEGNFKGAVDANAPMDVSLYLKSRASDYKIARTIARQSAGISDFVTDDAKFEKTFGASPEAVTQVQKFAADNGLKIAELDMRSGQVILSGTAGKFTEAFSTKLGQYETGGLNYRGRQGSLSVPASLAPHIEGIFGMDTRPQANTRYIKFGEGLYAKEMKPATADPNRPRPMMPNEVAELYNFPKDTTGKGQGVAIIELGGGIDMANEKAYYDAHGLKMPKINVIEIGGAKNKPGDPHGADGEVALDSQVIGAVAPHATQNLIFAPNSDRGFIDAVTRATFGKAGEIANQSISISWGSPEEGWTQQGARGMNMAFQKARLKGIGTYAASGDDGAVDRAESGKFNADYPASDPHVTGTGGTRLIGGEGKILSEKAWNNGKNSGAGGGGISELWDVPDYQRDLQMPGNANNTGKPGRGVPDVAGNADPRSGYIIRVGGQESAIGGTSAVSPLYAALHVRLTEALGKPIGNLNPFFYKNGTANGVFNDITVGNNNGYETKPGWDAVTGWGSINGTNLLNALKADSAARAKVTPMFPTPVVNQPLALRQVGG
jgi:kumamolisin